MKTTKDSQIRQYFNFYQKNVLPVVEKLATQNKDGYHGLYTHTDAVVFRAIDYALELGENPMPVLFAAACHDMARTHDCYDAEHGRRAVPLAKKVMAEFANELSKEGRSSVLYAIENHTEGSQTDNYVAACLWDADRTRLAWERGYFEHYFNTAYAKKVASGDARQYIAWQNKVLGRTNRDREGIQTIFSDKKGLLRQIERLKTYIKS